MLGLCTNLVVPVEMKHHGVGWHMNQDLYSVDCWIWCDMISSIFLVHSFIDGLSGRSTANRARVSLFLSCWFHSTCVERRISVVTSLQSSQTVIISQSHTTQDWRSPSALYRTGRWMQTNSRGVWLSLVSLAATNVSSLLCYMFSISLSHCTMNRPSCDIHVIFTCCDCLQLSAWILAGSWSRCSMYPFVYRDVNLLSL